MSTDATEDDICGRCGRTRIEHDNCDPMACGDFVDMDKLADRTEGE